MVLVNIKSQFPKVLQNQRNFDALFIAYCIYGVYFGICYIQNEFPNAMKKN